MNVPLIGTMLHGFWWGREPYCVRVEAVGADWIVGRDQNGRVHIVDPDDEWEKHTEPNLSGKCEACYELAMKEQP